MTLNLFDTKNLCLLILANRLESSHRTRENRSSNASVRATRGEKRTETSRRKQKLHHHQTAETSIRTEHQIDTTQLEQRVRLRLREHKSLT